MPLPKSLEDLTAMKAVLKALWSRVSKKDTSMFAEYASDASSLVNASFGKKILSYQKALLSKDAKKIAAAKEKCKTAFTSLEEKVKERIVKVKESEKKKAAAVKAKAAAAAAAAKAKSSTKAKKTTTKKAKKTKTKSKSSSAEKSSSFLWGGSVEDEDSDFEFDF